MELRINLATASLKDAEHAIFLIGAYFGMTNLPSVQTTSGPDTPAPLRVELPVEHIAHAEPQPDPAGAARHLQTAGASGPLGDAEVLQSPAAVFTESQPDPAQVFADPAQVFAGNVAGAAAVAGTPTPIPATVAPSAPTVAAPVGMPPAPTLAPAASVSSGVDLDAAGLPWDARIHSLGEGGAHPKTADGKWRKKRGVQPLEVARVEAELRATLALPAGTTAPPPVAPPVAPVAPVAPPVAPPAAPAQEPNAAPKTFTELMPRVSNAVNAQVIPLDALNKACEAWGLPNIPALQQRPDLVPYVWQTLRQTYPALQ